jgi:hypothetical protein
MSGGNGTKILVRPRKDRIVAGICAGIAGYSGLDSPGLSGPAETLTTGQVPTLTTA